MGDRHTTVEKYSLAEHAQLRHSLHHRVLLEHQRQGRILLPENFSSEPLTAAASEWALDDYYFLQPVPARQRRSMLREAGVARIDPVEREVCRSLRLSRSRCGCSCREVCRPPLCPCCRSGIGCQVDQMAFPCSCSHGGCANPHGRVEFNAARVRTHFIRTLLQLGLEQNGPAECDDGMPPPEKRFCLDSGQLPSSVSLPSLSTSSLLPASSACVNSASVSTANGFEAHRVYFDTVERLPGPEAVVVAYDEDCDDDDEDEVSSETSSDTDDASFDRMSDEVDGEVAAAPNDPRQRTLDNYVVRYRRQHTCADAGPSNCSTADFTTGFQFTSLPVPQQSPNASSTTSTATVTNGCQFIPLPVPQPSPSNCISANDTTGFQFTPSPVPPRLSATAPLSSMLTSISALNSSLNAHLRSVVTCPGMTLEYPLTVSSSVDTTHAESAPCSMPSVYNMSNDTRRDCALPGENTHADSVPEAISDNCCVSVATTHASPHVCNSTDGATTDCLVSDDYKQMSCTQQETTDNCSRQHSGVASDSRASQQDAVYVPSSADDTKHGSYSVLEDTTTCTWSTETGNCTPENTTQCSCEPGVTDSHSTEHIAKLGLNVVDHGHGCSVATNGTAFSSLATATQDTIYSCCRPGDTVRADCCDTDDDAEGHSTADSTSDGTDHAPPCGCSVPEVEGTYVSRDNTHCGMSLGDAAPHFILSGNTNSSPATEDNVRDDSNIRSHSCLDETSPICTAADMDDIIRSCYTSENATNGEIVPGSTSDGYAMPDDRRHGSSVPENVGSSCSVSDDTATADDCCTQ